MHWCTECTWCADAPFAVTKLEKGRHACNFILESKSTFSTFHCKEWWYKFQVPNHRNTFLFGNVYFFVCFCPLVIPEECSTCFSCFSSTSLVFLKTPACLYNSIMHGVICFCSYTMKTPIMIFMKNRDVRKRSLKQRLSKTQFRNEKGSVHGNILRCF